MIYCYMFKGVDEIDVDVIKCGVGYFGVEIVDVAVSEVRDVFSNKFMVLLFF